MSGGSRLEKLGNGYFISLTAVSAPNNRAKIAQEEIFGSFANFISFRRPEEAISIVNDTQYGLVSYVWSDHTYLK